jgi:hypothetical protein
VSTRLSRKSQPPRHETSNPVRMERRRCTPGLLRIYLSPNFDGRQPYITKPPPPPGTPRFIPLSVVSARRHDEDQARRARGHRRGGGIHAAVDVPGQLHLAAADDAGDTGRRRGLGADPLGRRRGGAGERGVRRKRRRPVHGRVGRAGAPVGAGRAPLGRALLLRTGTVSSIFLHHQATSSLWCDIYFTCTCGSNRFPAIERRCSLFTCTCRID